MKPIPLVRAAHLLTYMSSLREIGAPVDRELKRARLPTLIEETPDAYLSLPRVFDFVGRCSRDLDIVEFGHHAALSARMSGLSLRMQSALINAPSGLALVQAFSAVAPIENTALSVGLRREGAVYRIHFDLSDFRGHGALAGPEWVAVHSVIEILRSLCGAAWCPEEITLMSRANGPVATEAAYPNTKVRCGQQHTSVTVPVARLALAAPLGGAPEVDGMALAPEQIDFAASLRKLVTPYIQDGYPSIDLMAEITGLSRRTFQRRLARAGKSYRSIVQEARFQTACMRLADRDAKIIDVAFAAGYEHPQHFTRAFRKYTGLTPSQYRRAEWNDST